MIIGPSFLSLLSLTGSTFSGWFCGSWDNTYGIPSEFSPFSPVGVGSREKPSICFFRLAIRSAAGSTLAKDWTGYEIGV